MLQWYLEASIKCHCIAIASHTNPKWFGKSAHIGVKHLSFGVCWGYSTGNLARGSLMLFWYANTHISGCMSTCQHHQSQNLNMPPLYLQVLHVWLARNHLTLIKLPDRSRRPFRSSKSNLPRKSGCNTLQLKFFNGWAQKRRLPVEQIGIHQVNLACTLQQVSKWMKALKCAIYYITTGAHRPAVVLAQSVSSQPESFNRPKSRTRC